MSKKEEIFKDKQQDGILDTTDLNQTLPPILVAPPLTQGILSRIPEIILSSLLWGWSTPPANINPTEQEIDPLDEEFQDGEYVVLGGADEDTEIKAVVPPLIVKPLSPFPIKSEDYLVVGSPTKETLLHAGARDGRIEEIKQIFDGIKSGVKLNLIKKENPGLEEGVLKNLETNKELIDHTFEELSKIKTDLPKRCEEQSELQIKKLVTTVDSKGYLPLHFASKYGYSSVIKLLLIYMTPEDIAKKTKDKDAYNALHFAKNVEIATILIDAGGLALIHNVGANGRIPLHCVAERGDTKTAELLIKYMDTASIASLTSRKAAYLHNTISLTSSEANSTKFGLSALHIAAQSGHTSVVESLLKKYPAKKAILGLKTKDNDEYHAIHLASMNGYCGVVKVLLQHDPELAGCRDANANTPLHLASTTEVAVLLINNYMAPLDAQNKEGNTGLHLALISNNEMMAKFLLNKAYGSPTLETSLYTKQNESGEILLHLPRSDEVATLIMVRMKELNISFTDKIDKFGNTVLHNASKREIYSTVTKKEKHVVVKNGIKISEEVEVPYTVKKGMLSTVEEMLKNSKGGELANALNKGGCTPIHLATVEEIASLLFNEMALDRLLKPVSFLQETSTPQSLRVKVIIKQKVTEDTEDEISGIQSDSPLIFTKEPANSEHKKTDSISDAAQAKQSFEGYTLLLLFVKNNFIIIVPKLLNKLIYKAEGGDLLTNDDAQNIDRFKEPTDVSNPDKIRELMRVTGGDGNTVWHLAPTDAMVHLLQSYVPESKEIVTQNNFGQTPLHFAGQRKMLFYIKKLIEMGGSHLASIQDENGLYPLEYANDLKTALLLLPVSHGYLEQMVMKPCTNFSKGVWLVITHLSPDLIHQVVTTYMEQREGHKLKQLAISYNEDEDSEDSSSSALQKMAVPKKVGNACLPLAVKPGLLNIKAFLKSELLKIKEIINLSNFPEIQGFEMMRDDKPNSRNSDSPSLEEQYFRQANILYALGRQQEAIQSYFKVFETNPNHIETLLTRLSGQEPDFIEELLKQVTVKQRPNHTELIFKQPVKRWDGLNKIFKTSDENFIKELTTEKEHGPILYRLISGGKEAAVLAFMKTADFAYINKTLRYTAEQEDCKAAGLLLDMIQARKIESSKIEALRVAVNKDDSDMVTLLLKHMLQDEIMTRKPDKATVLHLAKSIEMLQQLIKDIPDQLKPALTNPAPYLITHYNEKIDQSPDGSDLYFKKGEVLSLFGETEQALECYSNGKEKFYAKKAADGILTRQDYENTWAHYSPELVEKLLAKQIQDDSVIIRIIKLQEEQYPIEGFQNLTDHLEKPQAIAICLSSVSEEWASLFLVSGKDNNIQIIYQSPLEEKVLPIVTHITTALMKKELQFALIPLATVESNSKINSGAHVVNSLAIMANSFSEGLTKETLSKKLATDWKELIKKHQLMVETDSFYSDLKFKTLLELSFKDQKVYITPVLQAEDIEGTKAVAQAALNEVLKEGGDIKTAIISMHPHSSHWSSLIIKCAPGGEELHVFYYDSTGTSFAFNENAEVLVSCLHACNKKTFITDLKKTQDTCFDNGWRTLEAIKIVVHTDFGQMGNIKLPAKGCEKFYTKILCDAGIPVVETEKPKEGISAYFCEMQKINVDSCLLAANSFCHAGLAETSLKYYTMALRISKLKNPIVVVPLKDEIFPADNPASEPGGIPKIFHNSCQNQSYLCTLYNSKEYQQGEIFPEIIMLRYEKAVIGSGSFADMDS